MALSIDIDGLDELIQRFSDVPRIVEREFDAVSNQALNEARRMLSREPAERPGQTYVRTHRLSGGWSNAPVQRQGLKRVLVNPVDHAGVVQGPPDRPKGQRQAWMHVGRWKRVDEAIEKAEIERVAEKAADAIARKLEGR